MWSLWLRYVHNYSNSTHPPDASQRDISLSPLMYMPQVIDQYLPDSHLFLGSVFVSVNWPQWMVELTSTQPAPIISRIHVYLLNLLVKLSNEPNVRQNPATLKLLQAAEQFGWQYVDATAYEQVLNWHVMSCDPRVVLCQGNEQTHPVDIAVHK